MRIRPQLISLAAASTLAAGCATCGPGTVDSDGGGWRFDRDGGVLNRFTRVCLPVSPVSDCTDFQMKEEDGGGWRTDRDGGGWGVDRDGGGWRRERDEPHHPGDRGSPDLGTIAYSSTGVCRVGVPTEDPVPDPNPSP